MNLERFIARRVVSSGRQSFTRLIIFIATTAIAISLVVMICTTALISGFKKEITEKIFGFWGHIHITDTEVSRSLLENAPVSLRQDFYPSLDTVSKVEYTDFFRVGGVEFENWQVEKTTKGGVRNIQVFALKPGIIQTSEQIEGIILKGVGPDFNWTFFEKYIQEGDVLNLKDTSSTRKVIISRQTADRLHIGIGDRFIIHFVEKGEQIRRRFEVGGIYKTGLEEFDKKFALADIREVREILGWEQDEVGGFEVFIDNIDDLDIITDYIYYSVLPNNFYAETIREKFPAIFEWLVLQDLNEVVILVLMLVVAIINMVTALLILILERTNMIGILKSVGQSDWSIRKIFLYYAAYIILIGLFWGNLIGIGLCMLQEQYGFIRLSEADYYLSVAPIEIDIVSVLLLNAGTLVVTLIFLILPSWLVTRISPVKAIRFK